MTDPMQDLLHIQVKRLSSRLTDTRSRAAGNIRRLRRDLRAARRARLVEADQLKRRVDIQMVCIGVLVIVCLAFWSAKPATTAQASERIGVLR